MNNNLPSCCNLKEKRDEMLQRFVTIWFCHLKTDWFITRNPLLRNIPFVLSVPDHGRKIITAVNEAALNQGIDVGMIVADARAIISSLEVIDDDPDLSNRLLNAIADWCVRYSDCVVVDPPDGIIMNVTGIPHLWGGEINYTRDIRHRLKARGYQVKISMADTIGAAWANTRYGEDTLHIEKGKQAERLLSFPPAALRLKTESVDRLHKLGLTRIRNFINIPRTALRRRFGNELLQKLDQALGNEEEHIFPVKPVEIFRERLPCPEPILTLTGIEIALEYLLGTLCTRLRKLEMGIRKIHFLSLRADGKIIKLEIGTHRASNNATHLFKLFEEKIQGIDPGFGIELFMLEVAGIEKCIPAQEKLWTTSSGMENPALSELLDRIVSRFGSSPVRRYLPAAHYLPEKSVKVTESLTESITEQWTTNRPRPLHLLSTPERIEVTAPVPDYPPMHFRYRGKLHQVKKAEGPERIEQEWWIQEGPHRDYYFVEDEDGQRYWLFRSGHYTHDVKPKWFIHGFFS